MAIEILDEHEQGERVRAWLRDNGGAIVGGIALGIAGIVGWQWWSSSKYEHRLDAATQYEALLQAVESKDRDALDSITASLAKEHADTPYAALATLRRSRVLLDAGEAEGALADLQKAVKLAPDQATADLARLRAARAQLGSGQAQAALDGLNGLTSEAYQGLAQELRGDALLRLGKADDARAAYLAALLALDEVAPSRRLVELKLIDLGGDVPPADAKDA